MKTVNMKMVKSKTNPGDEQANKLERLMEMLRSMKESCFTGYIKINFSQGGIARVEKFEEVLKGGSGPSRE